VSAECPRNLFGLRSLSFDAQIARRLTSGPAAGCNPGLSALKFRCVADHVAGQFSLRGTSQLPPPCALMQALGTAASGAANYLCRNSASSYVTLSSRVE
jgi:hypothetical protein